MCRVASLLEDWISHALTALVLGIAVSVVGDPVLLTNKRSCCGVVLPFYFLLSTPVKLILGLRDGLTSSTSVSTSRGPT